METKGEVEKVVDDARKINQVVARGSYGPEAARLWALLRTGINDLARAYGVPRTADAGAQRAGMDSARRTLQAMRLDENRLLAERVQVDQAAVRRLQFVSVALAVAASGFLVWIFWLIAGTARRQRQGADTLRQANENLEAQVDALSLIHI